MMIKMRFNITLICFSLVVFVGACERDRCEPPFDVGGGRSGLHIDGPIEVGDSIGLSIGTYTSSTGYLEDVQLSVRLPKELAIKSITQPTNAPTVVARGDALYWKAKISPSTQKEFTIWLISKTDWKKWSYPIEVDVSLYYTSKGKCPNYPDGFYRKKITWSHEGFSNPDWLERPKP